MLSKREYYSKTNGKNKDWQFYCQITQGDPRKTKHVSLFFSQWPFLAVPEFIGLPPLTIITHFSLGLCIHIPHYLVMWMFLPLYLPNCKQKKKIQSSKFAALACQFLTLIINSIIKSNNLFL